MRTRIGFLAQPEFMHSRIEATQRKKLRSSAWNWFANRGGVPAALSDEWELASDCLRSFNLCVQQLTLLGKSRGTVQLEIGAWVEMQLPNKTTPRWIYKANTKGPWSEARGPGIGGGGPGSHRSNVAIRYSNPWLTLFWSDVSLWVALWVDIFL